MNAKIKNILKDMTLEEKASLCSGLDGWGTKPVERLGVPKLWLSDGPHGLRRAPSTGTAGYGDQHPATCYPTASALAVTWNTGLIHRVGQALGNECQALDVDVILGPGVNIKRHPITGRNFEFFSEDPILSGELGAAYINGVQSRGVGTSLKHYALNNEEFMRMLMSSDADERTLREIYLVPFEICVKKARPATIMASYNRVNGEFATQNARLLSDILRTEWGYQGTVISDWVSVIDRVKALKAGLNIEMPGCDGYNDKLIVEAVRNGTLSMAELDNNTRQVVRLALEAKAQHKRGVKQDVEGNHALAREAAAEAMTLLKNKDAALPITGKIKTIAIIGEFAQSPRYQGNGSSEVKPTRVDVPLQALRDHAGAKHQIVYKPGYSLLDDNDTSRVAEAVEAARGAEMAIVFAGLPLSYESEGIDRKHMDMPFSHNTLIAAVAAVQPNTVVVLTTGSAITMPWHNEVKAILNAWLPGQAGAGAIADVLFGVVNPSGKLAETFPQKLEDTPGFLNYPGENRHVLYGERLYVGYRYYDVKKIEPLFPFGHGLSYTRFEYFGMKVSGKTFTDQEGLSVSLNVRNIGAMAGQEVVQLYVADKKSSLPRPVRELKKFAKIALQPGEAKQVTFTLESRDFSFFDPARKSWVAESGDFEVQAGSSSRDIRLGETVTLNSTQKLPSALDEYTFMSEFLRNPKTKELTKATFKDWLMSFAGKGQTLDDVDTFKFNDWLMDMPIIKYSYITRGLVDPAKVMEFVKHARELDCR